MADNRENMDMGLLGSPGEGVPPITFDMPAGVRGVIITDAEHKIRFTDPNISRLIGIDHSELEGKDLIQTAGDRLKARFVDPDAFMERVEWLCANPTETSEDVMELVEPESRVLHRYSAPMLDENRRPVGRIDVYSDITKRRRLEEANASLYQQVASAYEELQLTQEQLLQSEKLRAIGEIASGVAHDFNNTLGIILGNIQLLLRVSDDAKVIARLEAAERAALDGAETVRRIREFTKIQPDEPLSPVDLNSLVASVVDMMEPGWQNMAHTENRHFDVGLELSEKVFAVGIAAEIREILANIILNAVQAMPNGGSIRISTGRTDGMVWLKVVDSGIGMTEEVRKRVFDPFFTTRGVEGTGLGLSVAYGIVKRHNGRISIESHPGEGTTVTVALPSSDAEQVQVDVPRVPEKKAVASRILVIDDEADFAEVFVDMLSECGHVVCTAHSGDEGMEQFRSSEFDLVFTDLGMPGMSGWQVAKGIKEIRPATPVVLLTGWGTSVDEKQLVESSIDMVLAKPVKMEELSSVISRALATGRQI